MMEEEIKSQALRGRSVCDKDSSQKVVIADDDRQLRGLLREAFESMGLRVYMATDGQEAMDLTRTTRPDLLILDLLMPQYSGFEVLKTLKRDNVNTPVIVLTGKRDAQEIQRGLDLGVKDYITKPFSLFELLIRVRNILDKT